MAKSAQAFRTIGEVAEALDTPAHVLRFWESKFSQVRPVKRAGGGAITDPRISNCSAASRCCCTIRA